MLVMVQVFLAEIDRDHEDKRFLVSPSDEIFHHSVSVIPSPPAERNLKILKSGNSIQLQGTNVGA